jgi:predicted component of type VI protein secretion system
VSARRRQSVAGQWLSCGAPDRCYVWHEAKPSDEARRQYPRRETETQVRHTEERPRTYVGWDGREYEEPDVHVGGEL